MRGPRLRSRALLTCLIGAALVLLVAAVRPTPAGSNDKDWFWRHKTEWRGTARVVLAGNSRAYRGLDPSSVEAASGLKPAINFGFSGQVWSDDYLDGVENTLATKQGSVIVLAVDAPTLRERHLTAAGRAPRDGYEQALARSREAKLPALWEARLDQLLLPFQPADVFRSGTVRERRAPRRGANVYLQEWNLNGWIASDYTQRDPTRYLRDYWKGRSEENQRVDADTLDRLLRRIASWRASGIHVFAFRIPTTPETDAFEDKVFGYDEKRLSAAFGRAGAHWIEISDRAALVSYDGSHLARDSAVALSQTVGRAIARALPGTAKAP
jgi:hypothetical protein